MFATCCVVEVGLLDPAWLARRSRVAFVSPSSPRLGEVFPPVPWWWEWLPPFCRKDRRFLPPPEERRFFPRCLEKDRQRPGRRLCRGGPRDAEDDQHGWWGVLCDRSSTRSPAGCDEQSRICSRSGSIAPWEPCPSGVGTFESSRVRTVPVSIELNTSWPVFPYYTY